MNLSGINTILVGIIVIAGLFVIGGAIWAYVKWKNSKMNDGWMDEGDPDV